MKIEIGRFADKRLKMIKRYTKDDKNTRISGNEVSICPKISEVELERDVLEAVNLWNLMHMFPQLRKEIKQILKKRLGMEF